MTSKYFQGFDKLPKSSSYQVWADYIEILCLISISHEIAVGDLVDRLSERSDLGELTFQFDETQVISHAEDGYTDASQKSDDHRGKIEEYFEIIAGRRALLGEAYPFQLIEDNTIGIQLVPVEDLSADQILYLILLISSNLRYIKSGDRQTLTDGFEALCVQVLKGFLSSSAEVHIFSTKNSEIQSKYKGKNEYNKFLSLGKDIGLEMRAKEDNFHKNSTGEGGTDLVAWIPTGDTLGHKLRFFCQCTCELDLKGEKRFSSSYDNLRGIFNFQTDPLNLFFIPQYFKRADGSWENDRRISGVSFFDRSRIIWALKNNEKSLALKAREIVQSLINFSEEIY